MKRITICLTAFILSFIIATSLVTVGLAETTEREWLILVYVSGANDRGISGSAKDLINQLEKVGSTDKVTVLVKYTLLEAGKNRELQFQRDARTLLIKGDQGDPEITSPVIDSSTQTNMASQLSLSMFIRKSLTKYPAKKVMLVLWGKGEGVRGLLDDQVARKKMSMKDVGQSLSRARNETGRKMDVLVLDADQMQMAEIVYELKDEADIIIGSEEMAGVHYLYDLTLHDAVDEPTIDGRELAKSMIFYAGDPVSSAVRTDRVSGFMKLLDQWVNLVRNDAVALKAAAGAIDKTFHFGAQDFKDLVDFIDRATESLPPDSPVAKTGKDLKNYVLRELIVATHWAPDQKTGKSSAYGERSHGLAIYLPDLIYNSAVYEPLAFASHSQWNRLLLALMEERLKK